MKKILLIRNSHTLEAVINEEKESEYMNKVENQFANLKSVIKTQSIMEIVGSGSPIIYSPVSSLISLGDNELPYFISHGSQGNIKIIKNTN